ncbi:hypothetical protein LINPERHAP2_LOCUS13389 [Linum perenne]
MFVFAAIVIMKSDDDDQSFFVESSSSMTIRNEASMKVIVHCQSKDDDIGAKLVPLQSEFSWKFWINIQTLFWCDITLQDKRIHFDAINAGGYYCTYHWLVNDTGVHDNEPGCGPGWHIPWKTLVGDQL